MDQKSNNKKINTFEAPALGLINLLSNSHALSSKIQNNFLFFTINLWLAWNFTV